MIATIINTFTAPSETFDNIVKDYNWKQAMMPLALIMGLAIISGFVSDSSSGEALIGASVFLPEFNNGVATDKNGFYSIAINNDVSSSNLEIVVQYLGYATIKQKVDFKTNKSITLDFEMSIASIEMKTTQIKILKKSTIRLEDNEKKV